MQWLASHLDRVAEVDDAIEEYGVKVESILDAIAWGYNREAGRVFDCIANALEEAAAADDDEQEAGGRRMTGTAHAPGTVRRLTCACCGDDAGRWAQWWNQDTGFGICARCVAWIMGRETEASAEEITRLYGIEGVNWGAPQ